MDGFYVAKFIKIKDGPKKLKEEEKNNTKNNNFDDNEYNDNNGENEN